MDGLIKGFLDVALGEDDDRRNESGPHQYRDERSRSSWAEVVSGEQDKGGEESHADDHSHGRRGRNQWNAEEEESDHRQEEWEKTTQGRYETGEDGYEQSRWSRKEDDESNNDGWESVGKRPPRRTHKVQKDNWQGYKRPPGEQEFSDEVEIGGTIEPTEEELSDLSQACNKLWELDTNRLIPGKDYEIDCGEGKKVFQKEDMAGGSLFNWLNEDIFRRPTFSRFCSLLDNYNPNAGCKEVVTSEERQEQAAFIEEISRTAPIRYLHKYLSSKGIVSENYQDFKRTLTSLWFDLYGRGGTSGSSSAFEHVFVGEVKQRSEQEISGFHNWLQFYLEEAKGRVDYQGYIFPRRRGETPDFETQLLTIQFEWNGILKSVSSTLVGVSPEFEIALYTLCFFVGGEDNYVQLGPYSVNIKCYRFGDRIGSVFPVSEG
ncbi:Endoribonuclease XendoU [Parasponia andersonii]|uniref:Endoribonuclease XendoU n=1 Tax=Parasponia andersonii TaxID=3476 RepID=A0A2P5BEI4_PARAD|nr:Endoribonuclease XendoU [Parasponia andersonii]